MGYRGRMGQGGRRLAAIALLAAATPVAAQPTNCRFMDHDDASYLVCEVNLLEAELRLFWQRPDGTSYETFGAVEDALAAEGARLGVATNAGMFDDDHDPIGLYIEGGETLVSANTNDGPGNFHLKPNGVFYWAGDSAGIMETGRFLAEHPAADYATQSGPMLLIDGAVHPRFLADSDSFKVRSGVGIIDAQHVVFAISRDAVTFYDFALMFRDALGVRDALFLDGSISSLRAPDLDRPGGGRFGPILGVVER